VETSEAPIREKPPQAGETAPDFELWDSTGALRRLSEFCASTPLVLLFYRGHW
jgi:peroxiredoxin